MTEITSRLSAAFADRYRIERQLGEGGMATVYLAEDRKHERKVALKVLKPELAAVLGADRFVQEIKTTASLQHPHILPLFDSGSADGFLFYVMPYIEGETLRDKLDRETQLGIDEAVRLTTEVADALDYAHRNGVIHRDIKPENILLHDGRPMVADFGIALAVSAAAGGRMTETGLSLGTPHYMSPEQATAEKEITNRSDVYSLACVTYEMLAGDPPHTGSTAQQIIMKIVTEEATAVTNLRKSVPPNVAAALTKALQKLPADRFGSAADFAGALTDSSYTIPTSVTAAATAEPAARRRWNLAAFVAVTAAAAIAAAFFGRATAPEPPQRLARFRVQAPDSVNVVGACCGRGLALSPDGSRLVFLGIAGSQRQLYRREVGRLEPEPIPGTEEAAIPFFSPDGRWLGFYSDGYLRKVSMAGGPPVPIAAVPAAVGASWGDNDLIVYGGGEEGSGLYTVPAAGGEPERVTEPEPGVGHQYPYMLPGGQAALFSITSTGGPQAVRIGVADFETGTIDTIGFGTRSEYAAGYLVFTGADQTLLAQPFDPKTLRTTDQAAALLDGVQFRGPDGMSEFAVAGDLGLVYLPGAASSEALVIVAPTGRTEVSLPESGDLEAPSFSPDGRRIAVVLTDLGTSEDVWVFDREQGTLTRVTVEGTNRVTVWTPDGQRIAFRSERDGVSQMYWKRFDGSGMAELLLATDYEADPGSWLPDGRSLLFTAEREGTGEDIGLLTVGDSTATWILATEFDEFQPQASPDGRWMAYSSNLSGQNEVYVRALNGEGGRFQVSTAEGWSPRWSPDGRTLYYVSSGTLIAASVVTEPEFRVTSREERFEGITDLHGWVVNYDIHPNSEEFLVIDQAAAAMGGQLTWILDWIQILHAMGAAN